MSSAAAPVSATAPIEWITQEEQLRRLNPALSRNIHEITTLTSVITDMVAQYTLDSHLTHWFTALDRIGYKDKIPALPANIVEMMNSDCPIWDKEVKPDGTPYKISDTHLLYYDPPGTLNDLEKRVKAYGENALNNQDKKLYLSKKTLSFTYLCDEARQLYGDGPSEGGWIWISKGVLELSVLKTFDQQDMMIQKLSKRALVNYEVPTLRAAIAAAFFHKVATGEYLYTLDVKDSNFAIYTRVQEKIGDGRLAVSGDLSVDDYDVNYGAFDLGIAAQRTLTLSKLLDTKA